MRISIVSIAIALLLGCATTAENQATAEKYNEVLNSWLGSDSDSLVKIWGPPKSTYRLNSGGQMLTYRGESNPIVIGSVVSSWWCETVFTVDSAGAIVDWRYEGNNCVAK